MKYLSILLCLFMCYELSTQHRMRGLGRRMRDGMFEECAKSAGVTLEEMEALESGEAKEKFLNGDGDYRNIGCFSACVLQKYGAMEGATFVDHPLPDDDIPMDDREQHFIKALTTCKEAAEGAGDECDVALAFSVCMEKSRLHHGP